MNNLSNKISIVVPVYNSGTTLVELAQRVFAAMDSINRPTELILVDDGSHDNSWSTITHLKQQYGDRLKGVRLAKNFGQHNALCCGFVHATGNAIVTMDDDLQHPPEEISKMINLFDESGADVVYGMPSNYTQGALRKMGSSYVKRTSEHYKKGGRGGSAFRILKKHITDQIVTNHAHHFIYVDAIINWYTTNIDYVNVQYDARKNGKSSYSFVKLVGIYLNLSVNYSAKPLRWITWIGFIAAFFSFLIGIFFIYKKLFHNVPLGYTSTIVSITFGTGLILLSLGIIGQYVFKIYQLQYHKPAFYIQTVI